MDMIRQFIEKNPELKIAGEFVDNGLTGTNFDRPGFAAMMEAVRKGEVNCIVVKDLSRFGRNYLETGNYLERIFPYFDTRFISVTDHYDSFHSGRNDTLLVPLKSILHDAYAKDISKKVSTAIDIRKKSGKYMGKTPPYGYVRSANDRYKLVIQPERARIVRQIFQWRIGGAGPVTIARRLNDMEIPTQLQIRFMEGHGDGKQDALWHGSSVSGILKNPCYLGCIVERKSRNSLFNGNYNRIVPVSEWNLIEHTQEAIVDRDTFYQVQELMQKSLQGKKQQLNESSHRRRTENILSGIVSCGICGSGMHRDSGYFKKDGTLVHYSFLCGHKYLKSGSCVSTSISESDVLECVFQTCKKQLDLLINRKDRIKEIAENVCRSPYYERLKTAVCKLENKKKNLQIKRNELYAGYKEGFLTIKDYEFARDQYEAACAKVEQQIAAAQTEQKEALEAPDEDSGWLKRLSQFKAASSLTKEMCQAMVEKVVIDKETVRVHFSFSSEYERAIAYPAYGKKPYGGLK